MFFEILIFTQFNDVITVKIRENLHYRPYIHYIWTYFDKIFIFFSLIDVAPIRLYLCAIPSPGRTPKKSYRGLVAPIEYVLIKVSKVRFFFSDEFSVPSLHRPLHQGSSGFFCFTKESLIWHVKLEHKNMPFILSHVYVSAKSEWKYTKNILEWKTRCHTFAQNSSGRYVFLP